MPHSCATSSDFALKSYASVSVLTVKHLQGEISCSVEAFPPFCPLRDHRYAELQGPKSTPIISCAYEALLAEHLLYLMRSITSIWGERMSYKSHINAILENKRANVALTTHAKWSPFLYPFLPVRSSVHMTMPLLNSCELHPASRLRIQRMKICIEFGSVDSSCCTY